MITELKAPNCTMDCCQKDCECQHKFLAGALLTVTEASQLGIPLEMALIGTLHMFDGMIKGELPIPIQCPINRTDYAARDTFNKMYEVLMQRIRVDIGLATPEEIEKSLTQDLVGDEE